MKRMIPSVPPARRRPLLRLLRRIGVLAATALIVAAVVLFAGVNVSEHVSHQATQELLNGRADSSSLLLPLGLFVAGIIGLAICLK